jgi:tRNA modification GTPase
VKADAVMVVLDGSFSLGAEDRAVLQAVGEKKTLVVVNKSDLPMILNVEELELCDSVRIAVASAKSGAGISFLKQALRELVLGCTVEPAVTVTNMRHQSELVRSENALDRAANTLKRNLPSELVAVDLNEARDALAEITGAVTTELILERVFSSFCIGK